MNAAVGIDDAGRGVDRHSGRSHVMPEEPVPACLEEQSHLFGDSLTVEPDRIGSDLNRAEMVSPGVRADPEIEFGESLTKSVLRG